MDLFTLKPYMNYRQPISILTIHPNSPPPLQSLLLYCIQRRILLTRSLKPANSSGRSALLTPPQRMVYNPRIFTSEAGALKFELGSGGDNVHAE